ncbi:phosphoglucosamine mutase [Leptolyngbya sp. 7M]|uniref:phosphoglucosamine mutase n=1 Tax=Leptolyngbya sp. 7M TaxID=2812896 RepID=UPI001B8C3D06|nr:phosphoglucosamine mutase [Leptolyngbya sp. 7M]QYO67060.1 phosphoglucosamine mutase [Leptolyngbya sp. 7M]
MIGKLFGTDGIRGKAGECPLDDRSVFGIGAALAEFFRQSTSREPKFVTGRDTRESGPHIEGLLHAGMKARSANVISAGVITTPGVAFAARAFEQDAGVVISASHNPFEDNGIKIFLPNGHKAPPETEDFIEKAIGGSDLILPIDAHPVGIDERMSDEIHKGYLIFLASRFEGLDLSGKKLVIDCANGAASGFADQLFSGFGAEVVTIFDQPTGRNINAGCGSLHLGPLQSRVIQETAFCGIAFDGDADRALFVDENGEIVDGDSTLWVISRLLKGSSKLKNRTVVATVMSNIGLEIALNKEGITLVRTAVGDKYVLEELLRSNAEIGGEQSGHIIYPEVSIVGDGMLTALLMLNAAVENQASFSDLTSGFQRFPQTLVNVKVRAKLPFAENDRISIESAQVEEQLKGRGRLLLRYSGTENLARIMIEGPEENEIAMLADHLAKVIKEELG